jgi:hypothetical protein
LAMPHRSPGCDICALHKSMVSAFSPCAMESRQMDRKQKVPAEWGRRRTRSDPPVLDEAITAAQCLTDRVEDQIEIAAQLMGLPEDEVRLEVMKAAARPHDRRNTSDPPRHRRDKIVIVERRNPRAMLR